MAQTSKYSIHKAKSMILLNHDLGHRHHRVFRNLRIASQYEGGERTYTGGHKRLRLSQ